MSLTNHQRMAGVEKAQFLEANQSHINWGEPRPVPYMNQSQTGMEKLFAEGKIWTTDCAGAIQWIFKWIGAKTPTGYPFDEAGSSAMYAHLTTRFTDPAKCGYCTIGVYGIDGADHAVLVTKPGKTRAETEVFSHGSAYSCKILTLAEEDTAHVGVPFTFLSVGGL